MSDIARLSSALADRYHIERELGAGGMATVYLAHDLKHDRDVAIKVLHPDLAAALGGERFLSEIRTTARLQHPHILPLLDSGAADGLLYYVMPYVTGETLRTRLERERQLPISDAVQIAREVADALSAAHAVGVIHRDIKPENILLQSGHALVADFGIALAVQSAGGQRMTQTGLSLGTPQYMSPEQAMGERTVDVRSDIYALGAVTYEMLVGEPPFSGPSVQAIVAKIMTEKPTPLHTLRDTVPDHVAHAVISALAKLPADRFATAAAFASALHDRAVTASSFAQRRIADAERPERRFARTVRFAPLALGLVALGALGAWSVARFGEAPTGALTVTSILAPPGGVFGERRALALSPDGRRLAFVFASADGSRSLWVRQLDRLEAEPLPGTAGAYAPFWSPDGRSIGFFADGFLTVLDQNGAPRRLCAVSAPTGGAWSAGGTILFGDREGLSTVPATGGACTHVVARDSAPSLVGAFLPNDERIIYSRGRNLDMVVAGSDGKTLATLPLRAGVFAVVPPDYLIVSAFEDARALDARRINLRTLALEGPLTRVASGVRTQSGVHTFSFSANGAFAFLPSSVDRPYLEYDASGVLRDTVRVDGTWGVSARPLRAGPPLVAVAGMVAGLWLYDLDADRSTRLILRDSLIPHAGPAFPVFHPDGSHLLYSISGRSDCALVMRDLGTDTERIVLAAKVGSALGCPAPLDWSADGRRILLRRDTSLTIMSVDSSEPVRSIARPGRIWEGRFSPDGQYVAYSSDETGRAEIYVQSLGGGPPGRVSLEGGRWPAWTHQGRSLTFLTPDGRVQELDVGMNPTRPGGTPRTRFAVSTWRRSIFDDNGTGFAVVGDGERYIVRMSPSSIAVAYVQNWSRLMDASGRDQNARTNADRR